MILKVEDLYKLQKKLDDRISKEHPSKHGDDRILDKILALVVELGECANEVKSFKFWSNKGPSEERVILEEYVDCLHFILSIGIELDKETNFRYDIVDYRKLNVTQLFVLNISYASGMIDDDYFDELFSHFLLLGDKLGFTPEEIREAYFEKNKINHQRQEENY